MSIKPRAHWRLLIVMCLCILLNASQRLSASDDTVVGKKLIRIASELRQIVQPSMADIDLVGKVASWQQSGYDGMVFSVASHSNPENPVSVNGTWWREK